MLGHSVSIRSLADATLPPREVEAVCVTIRCYFDDSGTHDGSKVVVWGGVLGAERSFARLEKSWRTLLEEPLDGKPPLKQFHLAACASSKGEFLGYKEGERDRLRFLFRKLIADAKLYPLAYAVVVDDWNAKKNAKLQKRHGSANAAAFLACASAAIVEASKMPVRHAVCVFDKGQIYDWQSSALEVLEKQAAAAGVLVSYSFAAVGDTPALQAADIIATEHYWDTIRILRNPECKPSPHLQSLLNTVGIAGYSLHAEDMAKLRSRIRSGGRLRGVAP